MNINRHNYETFVIDYFDGKLDPIQTAELMYFLSQNPDLEYEFNAYENITLKADKLTFSGKESLKKNYNDITVITNENFDEFCIAETEGDLDEKSQARFYKYLEQNPNRYKELELYKKTILTPDKSIVFPDLNRLKRYRLIPAVTVKRILYAGVAAAIIIVVFLTFIHRSTQESELITSTKPAAEAPEKQDDGLTIPVEEKKEESATETFVYSKSPGLVSTESGKMIPVVNEVPGAVFKEPVGIAVHHLQPIEIRKIVNSTSAPDLAMLNTEPSVQHHVRQPILKDMSLADFFRVKLQESEIVKSAENLNVWTLAEASIKGINYLTESDIEIHRKLNMRGETSAISIESESFGFSAPIKK